jgi:hypothetical protein
MQKCLKCNDSGFQVGKACSCWSNSNSVFNLKTRYAEPEFWDKESLERCLRIALGGHSCSELWGEHGLIAATMRCVDWCQNHEEV